jgi:hypothetical protein
VVWLEYWISQLGDVLILCCISFLKLGEISGVGKAAKGARSIGGAGKCSTLYSI